MAVSHPAVEPSSLVSWVNAPLKDVRHALLDLFCAQAYQEGDFTLTSGQKSSYYINGKLVTLHPGAAIAIGRLILAQLPKEVQAVSGLTLGADPIVMAVSLVAGYSDRWLTPLIIRKEAKGHGTRAYIEGPDLPEGTPIAVLEDVVTTGQSALKAVERLQAGGYAVEHIYALVDRQQGGRELYESAGLQFTCLFELPEIQARWKALR
ncbi:MAG: orotate phosphoribosyltransferase [Prochlorotrichaceae cyanobacterium]